MCEFLPLCCGFGSMGLLLNELFFFKPDAVFRSTGLIFNPKLTRTYAIGYTPSVEDPQVFALGRLDGQQPPFILGATLFQLPLTFTLYSDEHASLNETLRDAATAELLSWGGHTVEHYFSTFLIPNYNGFCGVNIVFLESACNRQFCVKIMSCLTPQTAAITVKEYIFYTSKPIQLCNRVKSKDLINTFSIPVGVRRCLRD